MSVSLDELVDGKLSVTVNGKEYAVRPLDGFGYQLLATMEPQSAAATLYKLAAKSLAPGMTRDEVFGTDELQGLTPQQVGRVVKVASQQIEDVESTAPNDSGPLGQGQNSEPATPESPPAIQSAS